MTALIFISMILSEINEYRKHNNLPELAKSAELCRIALDQSQKMAKRGKLFHNKTLLRQSHSTMACENIATATTLDAKDVVNRWMKSKGHRENILRREIRIAGVGASRGVDGFYYIVIDFTN
jgi:uncharacterized protein YkwD